MKFEILEEEGRLDVVLSDLLEISRSKAQKLIKEENVLVNGEASSSSYNVKSGDQLEVQKELADETVLEPIDIPLDVVFENENLLILNKPSGLVVHPAAGHTKDTLVNALLYRYSLSQKESMRPGIVHRLDKDTSGLMMVAKNDLAHEALSDMLKHKEVARTYLALVDGVILHDTGEIDAPIIRDKDNRLRMSVGNGGKKAITHFKVLKRYSHYTLIECKLETGRTHQIRVHLDYIGHPVSNDPVYGHHKNATSFGQMLHSYKIEFTEPLTKEHLCFTAEPPKEFQAILISCEKEEFHV